MKFNPGVYIDEDSDAAVPHETAAVGGYGCARTRRHRMNTPCSRRSPVRSSHSCRGGRARRFGSD